MNDRIKGIIEERKNKDSELFFLGDPEIVSSRFNVDVTKRKNLFGVSSAGKTVLPPIYDEVRVVAESVVAVRIDGTYSLYNISDGSTIIDFKYTCLEEIGNFWKLSAALSAADDFIIYDTFARQVLNSSVKYEEYNLKYDGTEYYWARRGRFFDFIHRNSRECISVPGVTMAYDTESGMFGMNEHGRVLCFEENGTMSEMRLRETVSRAGGYLVLANYTYNIEHVIDVYGNILNI